MQGGLRMKLLKRTKIAYLKWSLSTCLSVWFSVWNSCSQYGNHFYSKTESYSGSSAYTDRNIDSFGWWNENSDSERCKGIRIWKMVTGNDSGSCCFIIGTAPEPQTIWECSCDDDVARDYTSDWRNPESLACAQHGEGRA